MKTIRTMLVDDERVGRNRLRRMLESQPAIEVVAECADGNEAVASILEHHPDLLFLDINMPGKDGFEVLEALGPTQQPPAVVFVTAYDEHAVRAFEACALDYLLKPASPERLARALERARDRLVAIALTPPEPPAPPTPPPRFTVRSGGRMSFISADEVDWAEAAGNYVILHVGSHNHMVRETMSSMEQQLPAENFMRVSRSAIVNLRRVKELYVSPAGANSAILHDGQQVHITRPLREVADRLATTL